MVSIQLDIILVNNQSMIIIIVQYKFAHHTKDRQKDRTSKRKTETNVSSHSVRPFKYII